MPELPDVMAYVEAFQNHFVGTKIKRVSVRSPFVVRTVEPELFAAEGKELVEVRRIGKRIIWRMEDRLFIVFHLMIAGRFHCRPSGRLPRGKNDLVGFEFPDQVMMLTEASQKKRASIHVVSGNEGLERFNRHGLDVLHCSRDEFRTRLVGENHILKRSLADPTLFDGIGNAYSDEILHAARLSPVKLSQKLTDDEIVRLYSAARTTLVRWIDKLVAEAKSRFPDKVTAFRKEMSVHGKYGQPCPVCHTTVQRIVYAENETNYCPRCQTEGKLLADRSLSRLLKGDWPKTVDEWEEGH